MALKLRITSPTDAGRIDLGRGFQAWRWLNGADNGAIVAHLMALTPAERRLRCAPGASVESLRRRYASIDFAHAELVGCRHAGRIVALIEICPDAHGAQLDIALSVDRALHSASLARRLLALAIQHALRIGDAQIELECLASNMPLRRSAECFGFMMRYEGEAMRGTLGAAPPDAMAARAA